MKKISVWCLIFVFEFMAIFLPSRAFAFGGSPYSGLASINAMVQGAANATASTVAGVTSVSSSAMEAAVLANGASVSVPAVATAGVTAARLGALAGTALKVGSWVGVAAVVIPWIFDKSGIVVCPPPDFFCKPGPPLTQSPTVSGGWADAGNGFPGPYSTPDALCAAAFAVKGNDSVTTSGYIYNTNLGFTATDSNNGTCTMTRLLSSNNKPYSAPVAIAFPSSPNVGACPAGFSLASGVCTKAGPNVPATVNDIATPLAAAAAADSSKQQLLYQMERDQGAPIFQVGDPVTVTAQPVTTPPLVTTRTINNPDGSTSTEKTSVVTNVTPQVQGSTVDNTTLNYPYTTTTTTTTTNNITNVTTVTITNETGTAQPKPPPVVTPVTPQQPISSTPAAPAIQIPTDYNREVTQQAILKAVDGTGVPDGSAIDKTSALTSIDTQNTATATAVNNTSSDSIGVFNWFPQIPTATCQDPSVANPITGSLLSVPICQPVNIFGKFISAVICFFALVGSVREVQSALKA